METSFESESCSVFLLCSISLLVSVKDMMCIEVLHLHITIDKQIWLIERQSPKSNFIDRFTNLLRILSITDLVICSHVYDMYYLSVCITMHIYKVQMIKNKFSPPSSMILYRILNSEIVSFPERSIINHILKVFSERQKIVHPL